MAEKLKALYAKHRELVVYVIFGGLTTAVNYIVHFSATDLAGIRFYWANILAWAASVTFAYVTNKRWVFRSAAAGAGAFREFVMFIGARLLSLALEEAMLLIFAAALGFNDKVVKIVSSVLVVIFNFVLSKAMVFRNKG